MYGSPNLKMPANYNVKEEVAPVKVESEDDGTTQYV